MKAAPTRPDSSADMRAAPAQRGFALMELLVALALIGLSCALLFSAQAGGADRAAEARFLALAARLAQARLAECQLLDAAGFAELADDRGDFGPEHPDLLWRMEVRELGRDDTGLAGSKGLLKAVDLSIGERGSRRSYTARAIVLRPLGR